MASLILNFKPKGTNHSWLLLRKIYQYFLLRQVGKGRHKTQWRLEHQLWRGWCQGQEDKRAKTWRWRRLPSWWLLLSTESKKQRWSRRRGRESRELPSSSPWTCPWWWQRRRWRRLKGRWWGCQGCSRTSQICGDQGRGSPNQSLLHFARKTPGPRIPWSNIFEGNRLIHDYLGNCKDYH